jgi:hypothetical protein
MERRGNRARLASGESNDLPAHLERVAKYVPSEVLAAYVALLGIVGTAPDSQQSALFAAAFIVCLVLAPIYLYKAGPRGHPKGLHLVVSTIAFFVWSYSIGGERGFFGPRGMDIFEPSIASGGLVVFTLISSVLIPRPKKDTE